MITVSSPPQDKWETALLLLFHEHPERDRADRVAEALLAAQRGDFPLDGLLVAESEGQIVGTELYVMQPDRTAFVWPPSVSVGFSEEAVSDALLGELCRRIDAAGAILGQCIFEPHETTGREALTRSGFRHVADLSYLERLLAEPIPAGKQRGFETVAFRPDRDAQRLAGLLEATYVGTLDCPGFGGTRTGAEALVSHQTSGEFDPARWKIFRMDDADVGVLLLNDHPDQNAWEVVYMGIVPEARGNGYGREMLIAGLRETCRAGRGSMLLAVDSKNRYARQIYAELGFVEIGTRSVHVRSCRRDGQ